MAECFAFDFTETLSPAESLYRLTDNKQFNYLETLKGMQTLT